MAIRINEDFMALTVDDRVVATARFSLHAAVPRLPATGAGC
jgi:hypothetical protein